ncbi:oligopeptide transport system permease protein [Scopulibacillus daqui]|uniref:Oligopeptide transport system permease protein n=1 Tax=Scopulibacillus daqui TaxID=1469162 RepID=A0ABS2PWT1_9BACL|nr:oligopeptide ABC transporter permease [Scopulibacillus daqui]MBM7644025.1 oligopeptide transport system permease protein [Scopulibacillus daqui]
MAVSNRELTEDMFQTAELDAGKNEEIAGESTSFWKDAMRRLVKNKAAVVSAIVIVFLIIMSIFGPMMNKYGYDDQDLSRANLPPKIPFLANIHWLPFDGVDSNGIDQYKAKNIKEDFWLGTDKFGRDQWTRIWKGTQISLFIAFAAAMIDLIIGVAYGGISAYFGGRVDNVMQRIIEVLSGIPQLIILILAIMVLKPGIVSIIIAMVITGWTTMARIVRSQILKLKSSEYVLASRTLGANHSRLILKHLLPNSLGQIIITTMFTVPSAIFFEAFLSFIGLGIPVPKASLGTLINDGFQSLQIFPFQVLWPAVVISLLLIAFNLLGDGLRDAFDPKQRK